MIVGQKDSGTTGNFEISVEGKLVSSKKGGDGMWYDDKSKYDVVFDVIEKAGASSTVKTKEIVTPEVKSSCSIL
jgi:hypothetical protein